MELQLKEFQVGKAISGVDYADYEAVIKPLRDQILSIHLGNARLALDLDNATLAAKDFNNKFENEFVIKQSVEADIAELKAMKDEYIRNYKDLENDIVSSQEELAFLKKNHEEELIALRQQVTGTVSVDVSSSRNVDLTLVLAQIREEYEKICKQNQADAETWYKKQIESQTHQTVQVNEAVESTKLQITELRRQCQTLQAEYDSLFSGNCSLEASIQEIDDSYAQKLYGLNSSISQMEAEMISLRNSIVQKAKDYENLLDIKMKLEMEITTYRKLLEGTDVRQDLTTKDSKETSGSITTITETRTVIG
ncbi:keratin, type 1 cytoskeletal 11-like isoform X2 [Heptranchias perlo]